MRDLHYCLGQVALSVRDLRTSGQWYEEVLGFRQAGRKNFSGSMVDNVTGVHGAELAAWWLVDRQDRFQLELFKVKNPPVMARPDDWRPCDIGYTLIGIHVDDFDGTLDRALRAGTPPLTAPMGETGARRVCLKDPDGVLFEVMEDDPRADEPRPRQVDDCGGVLRFVTLSVPDLAEAERFFADALGMTPASAVTLHVPAHEALWGLSGARRRSALFWADDILIEIVQYIDPVGRPWPTGYRLTDLGILNIAFLFDERAELNECFRRALAGGGRPNHPTVMDFDGFGLMYVETPQRFSLELVQIDRALYPAFGFVPMPCEIIVEHATEIGAPVQAVWDRVVAHERADDWIGGYQVRLLKPGREQRNGLGAVRELYTSSQWVLDEVVAWDPPRRIDLRMRQGHPTENHLVRIEFEEIDAGRTNLRYRLGFTPLDEEQGEALREAFDRSIAAAVARLGRLCEAAS